MTISFETKKSDVAAYVDPIVFGPLPLWQMEFFIQGERRDLIEPVLRELAARIDFLAPAYIQSDKEGVTLRITRLPRTSQAKQGSEQEFIMLSEILREKLFAAGLSVSERVPVSAKRGTLCIVLGLLRGAADVGGALPAVGFKEEIQKLAGVTLNEIEIYAFGESRLYHEPALLIQMPEKNESIRQVVLLARAAGQEKFSMQRIDAAQSYTVLL